MIYHEYKRCYWPFCRWGTRPQLCSPPCPRRACPFQEQPGTSLARSRPRKHFWHSCVPTTIHVGVGERAWGGNWSTTGLFCMDWYSCRLRWANKKEMLSSWSSDDKTLLWMFVNFGARHRFHLLLAAAISSVKACMHTRQVMNTCENNYIYIYEGGRKKRHVSTKITFP